MAIGATNGDTAEQLVGKVVANQEGLDNAPSGDLVTLLRRMLENQADEMTADDWTT